MDPNIQLKTLRNKYEHIKISGKSYGHTVEELHLPIDIAELSSGTVQS